MLRTRSPLLFKCIATPEKPFDLHVLTTPPAFILSQDQTLRKKRVTNPSDSWTTYWNGPEGSFRINLEYDDWGSQSIAQSKFQRAFPLRKEFEEDIFFFRRQQLSRKSFRYFCRPTIRKLTSRNPIWRRLLKSVADGSADNGNWVRAFKRFLEQSSVIRGFRWQT